MGTFAAGAICGPGDARCPEPQLRFLADCIFSASDSHSERACPVLCSEPVSETAHLSGSLLTVRTDLSDPIRNLLNTLPMPPACRYCYHPDCSSSIIFIFNTMASCTAFWYCLSSGLGSSRNCCIAESPSPFYSA
jgi:hypothetical protein